MEIILIFKLFDHKQRYGTYDNFASTCVYVFFIHPEENMNVIYGSIWDTFRNISFKATNVSLMLLVEERSVDQQSQYTCLNQSVDLTYIAKAEFRVCSRIQICSEGYPCLSIYRVSTVFFFLYLFTPL